MGSMHLKADIRQSQTLSPRLQHAVRMLQMSSLDFAAMVRSKMEDNPFLEDAEPADDRDLWVADMHLGARQAVDAEGSAMDTAACETTLAMHLHGQLNVTAMTPRDLCMARAIVESLDDDGYLRTDLQELAGLLALSPAPDAQEMLIALRLVQSLIRRAWPRAAWANACCCNARRWPTPRCASCRRPCCSTTWTRWPRATCRGWPRRCRCRRPRSCRPWMPYGASTPGLAGASAPRAWTTSFPT